MTKVDIIRMAREAGASDLGINAASPNVAAMFERFAALAEAAEREACAKVCDARYMGDNNREDREAKRCAGAIRARS